MTRLWATILIFLAYSSLYSQWSVNPDVNTKISDTTNRQDGQRVSPTIDGGCYVAWFNAASGNIDVYLQRLNIAGEELFTPGGILISSNTQGGDPGTIDLITDDSNNAVIVFCDQRNGVFPNPFAYKISPAGAFLWGANGVALTDSTTLFQFNPKVTQADDGNFVFTWSRDLLPLRIAIQKLNRAGVKQWGSSPVLLSGSISENLLYPDLIPSDSGSVILSWSAYTGASFDPVDYRVYTQKFSSAGTRVWNAQQDTVFDLDFGDIHHPTGIYPDGNNGAFYCWHDDRDENDFMSSYIQHYNSAGIAQFPINGVEASAESNRNKMKPVISYSQPTSEVFMFWMNANNIETMFGISGQKFNSSGVKQWGPDGKVFLPVANQSVFTLTSASYDTNAYAYFNLYFSEGNVKVKALKTGPSGAFHWPGNIITAADTMSNKSGIVSAVNHSGMSIIVWNDDRQSESGVYGQNINFDGSFGVITSINNNGSLPLDFRLSQNYPNPFNPETKINFNLPETSDITFTIYNSLGQKVYSLLKKNISAGSHSLNWNASGFPSGVYFYKLETGNFSATKKMLLIK